MPYIIPSHFFYEQEKEGAIYTIRPTNQLVPERVIKGLPDIWCDSYPDILPQKKTLILIDWTMAQCLDVNEKINKLHFLMGDEERPFKLYVWQEGDLIHLTQENVSSFLNAIAHLKKITPVYKKDIEQVIIKQGMSVDSCLFLDDHELSLLNPNAEWEPSISLNVIINSHFSLETIRTSLLSFYPSVLLRCVEFSEIVFDYIEKNNEILSCIGSITEDYQCTTLNSYHIDSLLQEHSTRKDEFCLQRSQLNAIKLLTIEETSLTLSAFQDLIKESPILTSLVLREVFFISETAPVRSSYPFIEDESPSGSLLLPQNSLVHLITLECHFTNLDALGIESLIKASPNLIHLKLKGFKSRSCALKLERNSLTSLKTLVISDADINAEDLHSLLNVCPNLEELGLVSSKGFLNTLRLEKNSLRSIKGISLNGSTLNTGDLQSFLQAGPNLEALNLRSCKDLSGCLNLSQNHLKQLKKIDFGFSNVSSQIVETLHYASPNVEYIDLLDCKKITNPIGFKKSHLLRLKSIGVNQSNFTADSLQSLYEALPDIDKINLKNVGNLSGSMSFKKGALQNVQSIDMKWTNITADNVQNLLKACPNTERFSFYCANNLAKPIFFEKNALLKLNHINFSHTNITLNAFASLLAAAPHLKTLILYSNVNLAGALLIPQNALLSLKTLDFSFTDLSAASFVALLEASPNLNEIKAHRNDKLSHFSALKKPSLWKLETLDFSDSEINSADLQWLLEASPNIKSLNLSRCRNINEPLTLAQDRLLNLERIDLIYTIMSPRTLQSLLMACPNVKVVNQNETLLPSPVVRDIQEDRLLENAFERSSLLNRYHPSPLQEALNACAYEKYKTFDADTSFNPNQTLHLKKLIRSLSGEDPSPVSYRLGIYNQLLLKTHKGNNTNPFKLSNDHDLMLKPVSTLDATGLDLLTLGTTLQQSTGKAYYLAHQCLMLTEQWQPLVSLSAYDDVSHLHLNKDLAYELKFSEKNYCYYIRLNRSDIEIVDVRFLFTSQAPQNLALPKEIQSLITELRQYCVKPLTIAQFATGADFLNAIKSQKVGACRHRAVVFKAIMDELRPQCDTRIVTNQGHVFAEIMFNDLIYQCDLGGYDVTIQIEENEALYQSAPKRQDQTPNAYIPNLTAHLDVRNKAHGVVSETPLTPEQFRLLNLIAAYKALLTNQTRHALSQSSVLDVLLTDEYSKRLIQRSNRLSAYHALIRLYQEAKARQLPVFLVQSAEDLYCAHPWIEKSSEGIGRIHKGPGGPFYEFVTSSYKENEKPLILINYAQFKPQDIVRFNSLLDEDKTIEGIAMAERVKIIGIQDLSHKEVYLGADFTSRFDELIRGQVYPWLGAHALLPEDEVKANSVNEHAFSINLFNAKDWKERLLGRWKLDGQALNFIEGAFVKALQSGKPIALLNAPLDDEGFRLFKACLNIDKTVAGIAIEPCNLSYYQGYDWKTLTNTVTFKQVPAAFFFNTSFFLLNTDSAAKLFSQYHCDKDTQSLFERPGLIEKTAQGGEKKLSLLLTASIKTSLWAELLVTAQTFKVQLEIHLLPNIALPKEISDVTEISLEDSIAEEHPFDCGTPTPFIYSNDSDVTIHALLKKESAQVIDVSDLDAHDLLIKLKASFSREHHRFYFSEHAQDVLSALQQGLHNRFILKGRFSQTLINALLPYIRLYPKGLILISQEHNLFNHFEAQQHIVDIEQRFACLNEKERSRLQRFAMSELESFSLTQLRTLAHYQTIHPDNPNPKAPWDGFYSLATTFDMDEFNPSVAQEASEEFIKNRFHLVENALLNQPIVFIGGLTGVGKSSYIEHEFSKKHPVFMGEHAMRDWALNPAGGYLFIDEANISNRNWSEFEGLFNALPFVLIEGKIYSLSPNHKVIFAGNPLNYGGSRQQASLFRRHGNSIVFKPLPVNVIYQQILKPIFSNTALQAQSESLSAQILKAYHLLQSSSPTTILATPRHLKSIAMLAIAEYDKNHSVCALTIVHKHIRALLRPLLSQANVKPFDIAFPQQAVSASERYILKANHYLVTPTRMEGVNIIEDFLTLRQFKRARFASLNSTQCFGDLACLTLESEPGLGKSQMLQALMVENHINRASLYEDKVEDNVYYSLPVSLSFDDKARILRKAFAEGNIVIMDEINSSPMMERLVNSLLMGQTPEGQKPNKPGFLLLGTQNPVSMGARIKQSEAQAQRMVKLKLSDYPHHELVAILMQRGLKKMNACAMVYAFRERQNQLNQLNNESSSLNIRDLFKLADNERWHANKARQIAPADADLAINSQTIKCPFLKDREHPTANRALDNKEVLTSSRKDAGGSEHKSNEEGLETHAPFEHRARKQQPLIPAFRDLLISSLDKEDLKQQKERQDSFFSACEKGQLAQVQRLLPEIKLNQANKEGMTGLCLAAKNNHANVVIALLSEHDIDYRKTLDDKRITLAIALEAKHQAVVKAIVAERVKTAANAYLSFKTSHRSIFFCHKKTNSRIRAHELLRKINNGEDMTQSLQEAFNACGKGRHSFSRYLIEALWNRQDVVGVKMSHYQTVKSAFQAEVLNQIMVCLQSSHSTLHAYSGNG